MVINYDPSKAAKEIAALLCGSARSNPEFVANLERALETKKPATFHMWTSASRVFSSWFAEFPPTVSEGDLVESLERIFNAFFESRAHLSPNTNRNRFGVLKGILSLHPDIRFRVSESDWSRIKNCVQARPAQAVRRAERVVVQPICKEQIYRFSEYATKRIEATEDPKVRQRLLCTRAMGAVGHAALLRGVTLRKLKINNIEELLTNTLLRRDWDPNFNQIVDDKPAGALWTWTPKTEIYDPPIGSVTCSVVIQTDIGRRFARVGPDMADWVFEWLRSRMPYEGDEWLFSTNVGSEFHKRIKRTATTHMLNEILQACDVPQRHVKPSSLLYGGIVDRLRSGMCPYELSCQTRINQRGVSPGRIINIDEQLRSHVGPIEEFVIEF